MNRVIQLIIFVSVFFLGFLALNYIDFYLLGSLFALPRNGDFYILVFLASLFYPIAAVFERINSNRFTNTFYYLAASWVGLAFFLLWALIIYEVLNLFFKISPTLAGIIIIAVTGVISFYALLNGYKIYIKKIEVPIKGLKSDFNLLQLSDVHIGPIRNKSFVERVVNKCNELNPDFIVVTGDLFDGSSNISNDFYKTLNKFKSPVIFTPGNHDYFQGLDEILEVLNKTDIQILRNRVYQMGELQILGVDYSYRSNHLQKTLQKLSYNPEKPCLLLYHLPDEFRYASQMGIDLQLSGHTHHGQFYPFNLLVKIRFRFLGGLYNLNEKFLYVSSGTGTWGPPMRLGSRNQITSILLTSDH
jgi:predicted MPP superfamily phosphohydrolase